MDIRSKIYCCIGGIFVGAVVLDASAIIDIPIVNRVLLAFIYSVITILTLVCTFRPGGGDPDAE